MTFDPVVIQGNATATMDSDALRKAAAEMMTDLVLARDERFAYVIEKAEGRPVTREDVHRRAVLRLQPDGWSRLYWSDRPLLEVSPVTTYVEDGKLYARVEFREPPVFLC